MSTRGRTQPPAYSATTPGSTSRGQSPGTQPPAYSATTPGSNSRGQSPGTQPLACSATTTGSTSRGQSPGTQPPAYSATTPGSTSRGQSQGTRPPAYSAITNAQKTSGSTSRGRTVTVQSPGTQPPAYRVTDSAQQTPRSTPSVLPIVGESPGTRPQAYRVTDSAQLPAYLQNILNSSCVQTGNNGYPSNVIVVTQPVMAQPIQRTQDCLTLSLISLFFCCPLALCAIKYSIQSQTSAASGDYWRSRSEGHTARNIAIAAILLGIVLILAGVLPIVLPR